jgi:hypothetical protein
VIRITHELVKKETERKHNMLTLSDQDLRWCFGAKVKFSEGESGRELIKIEDTVILGLAWEMCDAFGRALKTPGESIMVIDYYGTFDLTFNADEKRKSMLVAERHQKKSFVITVGDFRQAFNQWIDEIDRDMQAEFPEIQNNPSYVALIHELEQI